jgi:hypothetical protein
VREAPESIGTEEFCNRIRKKLQDNAHTFADLRGLIKNALSMKGEGLYKVSSGDLESLMSVVGFEAEFGCKYTEYLRRACLNTVGAKSTGTRYGNDWAVISKDNNKNIKCKRLWKKMEKGQFRELQRIMSEFLLGDIGQAKLSAISVIVRPKGARSGLIHNDCKVRVDGKYVVEMWADRKGAHGVGTSFWIPMLNDKIGKNNRVI